jgi:hypothetical protein
MFNVDYKELKRKIGSLTHILFFPSWRKLIGEDFKGNYLGQPVLELVKDNVAILPERLYTGQDTSTGVPYVLIIGPGVYYTQFSISKGKIITDHRELTGIIIPLEIYDDAQSAGSIINSDKLRMTELLISVPFLLILTQQTTQMFLRGVIARNIIHPYKDCFDQLLKVCRDPNTLTQEEGFKIISEGFSTNVYKNSSIILTEKDITDYEKVTAGVRAIIPTVNTLLDQFQLTSEEMKSDIFNNIKLIKKDFIDIGYPHLLDWVP